MDKYIVNVHRTANPLPFFVEVGVLRVLPREPVVSFVVALDTTIAQSLVALSLEGSLSALLLSGSSLAVDQSLADEQETLEGSLSLEHFVLPKCLLELLPIPTNAYIKSFSTCFRSPCGIGWRKFFSKVNATYDSDNLSILLESTYVVFRRSERELFHLINVINEYYKVLGDKWIYAFY
jgi:hypothetical protein